MNQQIYNYLSRYKDQYSYDVLKQQLIKSGYKPEDIDKVYSSLDNSSNGVSNGRSQSPSEDNEDKHEHSSKLSFIETIKNGLQVFTFKEEAVKNLAHNKNGIWFGLIFLYIMFVISGLLSPQASEVAGFFSGPLMYVILIVAGLIITPFILLGFVILNSIYHFVASLLLGEKERGKSC